MVYTPLLGVSVARGGSSGTRYTLIPLTSRRRIYTTNGLGLLPPRPAAGAWSQHTRASRSFRVSAAQPGPTSGVARFFSRGLGPQPLSTSSHGLIENVNCIYRIIAFYKNTNS